MRRFLANRASAGKIVRVESFHYPVTAIAVFGASFIVLAAAAPWLSWNLGTREMKVGERLLSAVLGAALVALWAIWRWLV